MYNIKIKLSINNKAKRVYVYMRVSKYGRHRHCAAISGISIFSSSALEREWERGGARGGGCAVAQLMPPMQTSQRKWNYPNKTSLCRAVPPLYEGNARTVLRIKVASAWLMLRYSSVLLPQRRKFVKSYLTHGSTSVSLEMLVSATNRGSSLLQTRVAHPTRILLFFCLSLFHACVFHANTHTHTYSLSLSHSSSLHPAGYPNRKVPPGRSFSWGGHTAPP